MPARVAAGVKMSPHRVRAPPGRLQSLAAAPSPRPPLPSYHLLPLLAPPPPFSLPVPGPRHTSCPMSAAAAAPPIASAASPGAAPDGTPLLPCGLSEQQLTRLAEADAREALNTVLAADPFNTRCADCHAGVGPFPSARSRHFYPATISPTEAALRRLAGPDDHRGAPPRWVSVTFGTVLCTRCAGIHRSIGVDVTRVRGLDLDTWDQASITQLARHGGNTRVNTRLLALAPSGAWSLPENVSYHAMHKWTLLKYKHLAFSARIAPEPSRKVPPPRSRSTSSFDSERELEYEDLPPAACEGTSSYFVEIAVSDPRTLMANEALEEDLHTVVVATGGGSSAIGPSRSASTASEASVCSDISAVTEGASSPEGGAEDRRDTPGGASSAASPDSPPTPSKRRLNPVSSENFTTYLISITTNMPAVASLSGDRELEAGPSFDVHSPPVVTMLFRKRYSDFRAFRRALVEEIASGALKISDETTTTRADLDKLIDRIPTLPGRTIFAPSERFNETVIEKRRKAFSSLLNHIAAGGVAWWCLASVRDFLAHA
ncbi:hypothetical protein H696_01493 [Fonticula alba]|uniref:Arf-GAP domain-containing protein n=1 Tax=Fonticula alba TaxID=691883 RepID=A0A058ZCE8_FONAL|nr:hypothetical protein H696_01493 [Fonticula alba]KCV72085.1 hypothetical protein H696_01493 [Fonticula alba]|eukprot:XP_009493663.1 hypothetical protein H696_01493 [Fonticula alba]